MLENLINFFTMASHSGQNTPVYLWLGYGKPSSLKLICGCGLFLGFFQTQRPPPPPPPPGPAITIHNRGYSHQVLDSTCISSAPCLGRLVWRSFWSGLPFGSSSCRGVFWRYFRPWPSLPSSLLQRRRLRTLQSNYIPIGHCFRAAAQYPTCTVGCARSREMGVHRCAPYP